LEYSFWYKRTAFLYQRLLDKIHLNIVFQTIYHQDVTHDANFFDSILGRQLIVTLLSGNYLILFPGLTAGVEIISLVSANSLSKFNLREVGEDTFWRYVLGEVGEDTFWDTFLS